MLLKAAPASVRSPANVVENMVMRGAGFVAVSATLARVRLPAWGFLLVFYSNHSPRMHRFELGT